MSNALITPDPWDYLRRFTKARIALGRCGASLPTTAQLAFQLDHAQARDAVHLPLDLSAMRASLQGFGLPLLEVDSQAGDRSTYLQRPDLGRRLDAASRQRLLAQASAQGFDACFVIADGLSALALHRHAAALLERVLPPVQAADWRLAPLVLARQARVALGDEIGACLQARLLVMLIGERPGLSSPDSLGVYLTWNPHPGCRDAERNCLSNIRPAGLDYDLAAHKLLHLMRDARRLGQTGLGLKDAAPPLACEERPASLADG